MAKKGNTNAQKHGAEAAIKRIADGKPFTGLAVQAEQAVTFDLETQGRVVLMERNAIRAQAATDLFWTAIIAAADRGDLKALDGYIARFGWLVGVAGRQWEALDRLDKRSGKGGKLAEVLDAYQQNRTQDGAGSQPEAPGTAQTDQDVQDDPGGD